MGRKVNLIDVIKSCETRFDRGEAIHWTHTDFINLSKDILSDTKVNISVNTLKRIFGKLSVDKKYIPQEATIEALQKYGGIAFPDNVPIPVEVKVKSVEKLPGFTTRVLLYLIAFVILGFAGFIAWKALKPSPVLSAQIELKKTEGLLPLTAIFDLQMPESPDSIFADFGDKSMMIYVKEGQKKITHNYLYSGVFKVSLRTRQSVIAETIISVDSKGWIVLGYHDPLRNHYFQIPFVKTAGDSLFNLPNLRLHLMGLDTAQRIFTRLYNYTPVNYSSDDFTFEATFKNPPRKSGLYCNSTQFQISGFNSMIRFKLSNPGCSSRVINVLSEQRFDGDRDDLSDFVLSQEDWNTVKMVNRKKHVSLFVNGKLLFEGSYQRSLGEIKGLFIEFEGNGFVKNCELKAGNGHILYHF